MIRETAKIAVASAKHLTNQRSISEPTDNDPATPRRGLLGRLSRITTPGRNFIPQIDGLRFIAIMAVIAYHLCAICKYHFGLLPPAADPSDLVTTLFDVGHLGVQLFFAVSGFILVLPFARQMTKGGEKLSLKQYYLRRVSRIEPPYIIHLAFLCAATVLVLRHVPAHTHLFQNPGWAGYAFPRLLSSLVYSNGLIFGVHPYPNVVLWSLEVEVQFYILAPFLANVFRIRSSNLRRGVLVSFILLFSLLTAFAGHYYRVQFSLAGNLAYFLVGFLLVDFYLTTPLAKAPRRWSWDICCLFAVLGVILTDSLWLQPLMLPWLILLCSLAAFRGNLTAPILSNPWIITIGGMCYTIYMYHWLLISLLLRFTGRLRTHVIWLDMLIQFVLITGGILIICAILFALFERPFMRRNWPETFRAKVRSMLRLKSGSES